MFTVTESATEYLKRALVGVDEPPEACFRIRLGAEGPLLTIDKPRPEDTTVDSEGEVLLVADPETSGQLEDYAIDYDSESSQLAVVKS